MLECSPLPGDIDLNDFLKILAKCDTYVDYDTARGFASALSALLEIELPPIDDPALLAGAVAALDRFGDQHSASHLRAEVLESWRQYARQGVRDSGVLSGFFDWEDAGDATVRVRRYFEEQLKECGMSLTEAELDTLEGRIDLDTVIDENLAEDAKADQQLGL